MPICSVLFFPHLGFKGGNLVLIAPVRDHCFSLTLDGKNKLDKMVIYIYDLTLEKSSMTIILYLRNKETQQVLRILVSIQRNTSRYMKS